MALESFKDFLVDLVGRAYLTALLADACPKNRAAACHGTLKHKKDIYFQIKKNTCIKMVCTKYPKILAPLLPDEPLPAAARRDRAHNNVARALARAAVQGPVGVANRLRARIHEYQPRGFHRFRQVSIYPVLYYCR